MPPIAPSGNSEGSTYLGRDGNAYQVIKGQDVRVSNDRLTVAAYKPKPLPDSITVDGVTYHRDKNGIVSFSENGRYIATTEAEIQKLDIERFGGRLQERLEQEGVRQQQQKYLLIGGALLVLFLLSRS
jgi:hypothetical protein